MSASDYKELEARLRDGRWSLSIPVEVEDDYNGDAYWSERRERSDDPVHAADAIADLRSRLAEAEKERDKYRDTLLARHGGEPLALLDELDAARHDLERAVAENARLWACVKAADAMSYCVDRSFNETHQRRVKDYTAARAALGDSHEHG